MAVYVHVVEREFLLKTAMDEKIPINCTLGGGSWNMIVNQVAGDSLVIAHSIPLRFLRLGDTLDCHFFLKNQTIAFKASILDAGEHFCSISMPEKIYKNLSRRYARMNHPKGLSVSFSFDGERYALDYPAVSSFVSLDGALPSSDFDPANVRALVQDFNTKAALYASHRGIILFKDREPKELEEIVVAETGWTYYFPTVYSGLPTIDPYTERRILTRSDFIAHKCKEGMDNDFAEDEIVRFEHAKRADGIISELMIPIRFQEYVIGYVHLANKKTGKPPFDLGIFDLFSQFSQVFAYSLKANGYFKGSPENTSDYPAQIIDISAGGLLFTADDTRLSKALIEGSRIALSIDSAKRSISVSGDLIRRFNDRKTVYYAIRFSSMSPEDFRYLFERLYGRPFKDIDAESIEGMPLKDFIK